MINIFDKLTCLEPGGAPSDTRIVINIIAECAEIVGGESDASLIPRVTHMVNSDSKKLQKCVMGAASCKIGMDIDGDVVSFEAWARAVSQVFSENWRYRFHRRLCQMRYKIAKRFRQTIKNVFGRKEPVIGRGGTHPYVWHPDDDNDD